MLFKSQDERTPKLLQGSFVTPAEIIEILENAPEGYDDIDMLEIKEPNAAEIFIPDSISPKEDKRELADILFWTLGQETISANKIQKQFKIGKRVNEIIEIFNKMGIITDKHSNQPRTVKPACMGDLSSETISLLERYSHTIGQINEIFEIKNGKGHSHELEHSS